MDVNFKLREEIANKEVEIEQLNKSLLEPKTESQTLLETMKAAAEMSKAMQGSMQSMQQMVKDLTIELGKAREAKESPKSSGACGGGGRHDS